MTEQDKFMTKCTDILDVQMILGFYVKNPRTLEVTFGIAFYGLFGL